MEISSKERAQLFEKLVELKAVPVPPMLEQALDYPSHTSTDAKFVSFYYTPFGDESMYDDGRESGTGDPYAFLEFVQHQKVWRHLTAFDFGSSDYEGKHRLLLDRETRKLYGGPARVVSLIVSTQWQRDTTPESEIPYLTPEQMEEVWAEIEAHISQTPSDEEIEVRIAERRQIMNQLLDWLNKNAG